MSQREKNKQLNRKKIIGAARKIITREGIDKLTMRYLAEKANVSLRTPYNLFGSKTDVLLALLDEVSEGLGAAASDADVQLVLEGLLHYIDKMRDFYEQDETFYRDVYWGIMTSDHQDARIQGINRLLEVAEPIVQEAIAQKELDRNLDAKTFSKHLVTVVLAILGMWGAAYFSSREMASQIKYAWCNAFLAHATRKSKSLLLKYQTSVLQSLETPPDVRDERYGT